MYIPILWENAKNKQASNVMKLLQKGSLHTKFEIFLFDRSKVIAIVIKSVRENNS